jgi:hypothetical protein
VNGTVLTQLLLKSIILLERAGAKIHGFVSDGATMNRKVWTELGLSGKVDHFKNYFVHPLNDHRKVYAFSDTPHLIKCIRNRLYNNKTLKVSIIENIYF